MDPCGKQLHESQILLVWEVFPGVAVFISSVYWIGSWGLGDLACDQPSNAVRPQGSISFNFFYPLSRFTINNIKAWVLVDTLAHSESSLNVAEPWRRRRPSTQPLTDLGGGWTSPAPPPWLVTLEAQPDLRLAAGSGSTRRLSGSWRLWRPVDREEKEEEDVLVLEAPRRPTFFRIVTNVDWPLGDERLTRRRTRFPKVKHTQCGQKTKKHCVRRSDGVAEGAKRRRRQEEECDWVAAAWCDGSGW